MKLLYVITILLAGCFGLTEVKNKPEKSTTPMSFYNLTIKTITGQEMPFSQFKGKKVLLVNTASECGFTSQYEDLQKFSETYKEQVIVVGMPSNDFGGQEPGKEEEIQNFCKKNYGVTFPLTEKITIKGDNPHPVITWLSNSEQNGWNDQSPKWNFNKYLVSEKGELLGYYASAVKPFDQEITSKIK